MTLLIIKLLYLFSNICKAKAVADVTNFCEHELLFLLEPDGGSMRGGFLNITLLVLTGDGRKVEKSIQSMDFPNLRQATALAFINYRAKQIQITYFLVIVGYINIYFLI